MKYLCYPEFEGQGGTESGFLRKFLHKDLKNHNDLRLLVIDFLKKIREADSLKPFLDAETISYLSEGYFEMRIPPQRKGGVVRIYFIRIKNKKDTLFLIDAELKKKKPSNIKNRVKSRLNKLKI